MATVHSVPDAPLRALVHDVEVVLEDAERAGRGEAVVVDALLAPMARFVGAGASVLTTEQRSPWREEAVGHLLHEDPEGRFHVLSVVFPPGTSSGIHEHGCWGVIGYLEGLDEETRYQRVDDGDGPEGVVLEEIERRVHEPGDVSRLLPPDEMFHRVRNPGPVDGVSVHVLCRTATRHPHRYWDRDRHRLLPFPFRVSGEGIVRAEVSETERP